MGAPPQPAKGSSQATRDAFGEALARLGQTHPEIVALDADLASSTRSAVFGKKFPERFFQFGIAEQNMLGAAAGLALSGKIPFCCSFACFVAGRFETVKISVAYPNSNVRIVGSHAGVGIGEDGYSQQGLEDIALMRSLPNMAVIQPADDLETQGAVEYLVEVHKGPAFLRTTRQKLPRVNAPGYRFEFGKAVTLRDGTDLAIFATGGTVAQALLAADLLQKESGISARVVNVHTLKPIDGASVEKAARECRRILSVEDHSIWGGLGSAVAEELAERGAGAKLLRSGLRTFGESGSPSDLYRHFGLDAPGIARHARSLLGN